MVTKITDGSTGIVRIDDRPVLTDFDGNDATQNDPVDLKRRVQEMANAMLPTALRVAHNMLQKAQSPKDKIEAAKFIKSLAEGNITKNKIVDGFVKKMSNDDLNTKLDGTEQ